MTNLEFYLSQEPNQFLQSIPRHSSSRIFAKLALLLAEKGAFDRSLEYASFIDRYGKDANLHEWIFSFISTKMINNPGGSGIVDKGDVASLIEVAKRVFEAADEKFLFITISRDEEAGMYDRREGQETVFVIPKKRFKGCSPDITSVKLNGVAHEWSDGDVEAIKQGVEGWVKAVLPSIEEIEEVYKSWGERNSLVSDEIDAFFSYNPQELYSTLSRENAPHIIAKISILLADHGHFDKSLEYIFSIPEEGDELGLGLKDKTLSWVLVRRLVDLQSERAALSSFDRVLEVASQIKAPFDKTMVFHRISSALEQCGYEEQARQISVEDFNSHGICGPSGKRISAEKAIEIFSEGYRILPGILPSSKNILQRQGMVKNYTEEDIPFLLQQDPQTLIGIIPCSDLSFVFGSIALLLAQSGQYDKSIRYAQRIGYWQTHEDFELQLKTLREIQRIIIESNPFTEESDFNAFVDWTKQLFGSQWAGNLPKEIFVAMEERGIRKTIDDILTSEEIQRRRVRQQFLTQTKIAVRGERK